MRTYFIYKQIGMRRPEKERKRFTGRDAAERRHVPLAAPAINKNSPSV